MLLFNLMISSPFPNNFVMGAYNYFILAILIFMGLIVAGFIMMIEVIGRGDGIPKCLDRTIANIACALADDPASALDAKMRVHDLNHFAYNGHY